MSKRYYIEPKDHTGGTETRSQVLAREKRFRDAIRNTESIVVKSKKEREAEEAEEVQA